MSQFCKDHPNISKGIAIGIGTVCIISVTLGIYYGVRSTPGELPTLPNSLMSGFSLDLDLILTITGGYNYSYDDPNTSEYKNLKLHVETGVNESLVNSNLATAYVGCQVTRFSPGSIDAHVKLDFKNKSFSSENQVEISADNIIKILENESTYFNFSSVIVNANAVPEANKSVTSTETYRDYFIRAEKIHWDYLPLQRNTFPAFDDYFNKTLFNRHNRVGSTYSKYVYKLYKDETFTEEIEKPLSLGIVGPLLHSEVGDTLRIHFQNTLNIPVSIHPHGVKYDKNNEGAVYLDNSAPINKIDDGVAPGGNIILLWTVTTHFAPTDNDPNCVPYAYHSHVNPEKEINAGLLGLLLVCKSGILNNKGIRSDVDKEFVLYFDSINEAESYLIEENLQRCGFPSECKRLYDFEDPEFLESLRKDSINGYMYGNMPGLEVCEGEKVAWYFFSLNGELHSINIQGQILTQHHQRSLAVVGIWAATFREVEMVARNPGVWAVQCLNFEHNRNGMKVLLHINECVTDNVDEQLNKRVRNYFLAAEEQEWDYAPSGRNMFDGTSLTQPRSSSEKYFSKNYQGKLMIGSKYWKSRFIQYVDETFVTKVNVSKADEYLGILGPVIRAEAGDRIHITLQNLTPTPVSIFLPGTSLDAFQNGMCLEQFFENPHANGSYCGYVVNPNGTESYNFTIPWTFAPKDKDSECTPYLYYSNYDMERDVNSGLVGPLLVCKQGTLDSITGKQKHVDREMFLYFSTIDENVSWHIDKNIAVHINGFVIKTDADFMESNLMRSINGRSYGNLEGLTMCTNERVVWYQCSFGLTEGNHVVTFNGNNVLIDGVYKDSQVIISGMTVTAVMQPNNIGNWSVHCHNDAHFDAGMKAVYQVKSCESKYPPFFMTSGKTRHYFIGAVEEKWNYSPRTIHPITEQNYSDPSSAQYFRVQKDGLFIGSVYWKALFREFSDATFSEQKPITKDTWHNGMLGPKLITEVGDTLTVTFKNMASRPYSIHAHMLRYNELFEGVRYKNGTPANIENAVPPGSTFTYHWEVPETSGPAGNGPNCVTSIYHSAVDLTKDTYSGLVGPTVVCRKGILDGTGGRTDSVEREFTLLFQAVDENQSWYINRNIQENCPFTDTSSTKFIESNIYDSVNGLIYNNVNGLVANRGENIAWYIMALGTIDDIHTVHFHGQTYILRTDQTHVGDVVEVFPGTYETVEMYANNPGTWLIHCHVGAHMRDGMIATYVIK